MKIQKQQANNFFKSHGLVLSYFDKTVENLIPYCEPGFPFSTYLNLDSEFKTWLQETLKSDNQNIIYTSPTGLTWMYLSTDCTKLYIGPVYQVAPNPAFLQKHGISGIHLPVIKFLEFQRICALIFYTFSKDNNQEFIFTAFQKNYGAPLTDEEMYFSQSRNYTNVRLLEKHLTDCVRTGNVEHLSAMSDYSISSPARLAKDDVRDMKNRFITTITLVMRAAVDGGLPAEIAYPLSDIYLLDMENKTSASQVMRLLITCVLDYANRVRDCQKYSTYGALVKQCCSLILANINENLKINDLANRLSVCPDHLSRQFKKETGISISDYVQSQKTDEAIRLLKYTNLPLVTIANRLGYSSQSQFNDKFKQITGMTPGKYRKL